MLFQLPSVCTVSVEVSGKKREPDKEGSIGKLKPGDQLVLQLEIGEGHEAYLYPIDCEFRPTGDGKHKFLPSLSKPVAVGERLWRYNWYVGEYRGKAQLDYNQTRTRILALQKSSGHFALYEVGVLMRGGEAFLVDWQRFRGQAYQDSGTTLRAPAVGNWETLQALMQTLLGPQYTAELPDFSEYKEPERPELPDKHARVTSFDAWKGIGTVILHNGGEASVYWSQIINSPHRVAVVVPGQTVRYEKIQSPAEGHKLPQIRKVEIV